MKEFRPGIIGNALFREAIDRAGLTNREVAVRAGIDEDGLRRMLGAPKYRHKDGKRFGPYVQRGIARKNASRIARALHLDPTDCGL